MATPLPAASQSQGEAIQLEFDHAHFLQVGVEPKVRSEK